MSQQLRIGPTPDALDRERPADVLTNVLKARKGAHPMALALFGAWGAGMSSLIGLPARQLERETSPRFRFASSMPGRNERVDNIGAAPAQSVVETLTEFFLVWAAVLHSLPSLAAPLRQRAA